MAKHANHRQGLAQPKNEYGIEAGQILMQNIQERLTGLWPATGASSRRTARFAVSISASLTAGDDVRRHGEGKKHLELFNARKSTNQVTKYYVSSNSSSLDESVIKAETLISLAMAKHNVNVLQK